MRFLEVIGAFVVAGALAVGVYTILVNTYYGKRPTKVENEKDNE